MGNPSGAGYSPSTRSSWRPHDTDRWASPPGSPPAVSSPPGHSATPPARPRLAPASMPWPSRDTDPTGEGLRCQIDIRQDMHEIDDRLECREEHAVNRPDPRPAVTQEGTPLGGEEVAPLRLGGHHRAERLTAARGRLAG